jgi:hypothetical protein
MYVRTYCHVFWMCDLQTGYGLVNRFIDRLYTPLGTILYSSPTHRLVPSVYQGLHQSFPGNRFNTAEILQLPWSCRFPLVNTPHLKS